MSSQRSPTQRSRTKKDRHYQLSSQNSNNDHDIGFAQPMNRSSSQDRRDGCCEVPSSAVAFGVVAAVGVVADCATGGAVTATALSTLPTVDPGTLANCWDGAIRISEGVAQHYGSILEGVTSPVQSFTNNIIDGINQLCSTTPSTDERICGLGTIYAAATLEPVKKCLAGCLTNVTDCISERSSSTPENTTPANSPSLLSFLGLDNCCATREKQRL